jgi:hypothetical protein
MPQQSRLLLTAILCTLACTDDAQSSEQGSEDTGPEPGVTLATNYDATSLCGAMIDRVEFATRRRNCWDPELPCTLAQDPPWITGTSVACADLTGSMRWAVVVAQTGQWETQLRALAGGSQQGVFCFAIVGQGRTNVANADLDMNTEFALVEVADSECSNP